VTAPVCPRASQVDDHFAGHLAPRRERELRAHLSDCPACHTRYERHLKLAALDPRALPFEERLARALGLRRRHALVPVATCAALAGTAALVLVLLARPPGDRARAGAEDGFRPRGAPPSALVLALDARATEVLGFRTGAGRPALATEPLSRSDELAFAYRNGGGWPQLMVFARDDRGGTYWFHPSWNDRTANPTAVPISAAPGVHELPRATTQTFAGSRLSLCALTTRDSLSVREVEAALDTAPGRAPEQSLAASGRAIACRTLKIAP